MIEKKIGEVFTAHGKKYEVVRFNECHSCDFCVHEGWRVNCVKPSEAGECLAACRSDFNGVMFKEVDDE